MKGISSVGVMIVLLQALAGSLSAQGADLLKHETPPLASLAAFDHEEPDLHSGEITLSRQEGQSLNESRLGEKLTLPQIDQYMKHAGPPLEFRRVELFAPGARVMLVDADGMIEWQQDARQFFVAGNSNTGVGLALDTVSGEISGYAIKGGSKMQLQGQLDGGIQVQSIEEAPEGASTCDTNMQDQPPESLEFLNDNIPESLNEVPAGSGITFQTVIAVDTDNEWMDHRGNDPDAAMTWITDAFLAMNVFYERDLSLHLLIGDVFLRTSTDPYSIASGASDQMNEFATHWRFNMASVQRDFATLLSGRGVGAYSYSGIAWLNQYCVKGVSQGDRTRGSYSFNAMGVNRTAANTAIFIGHELGHNFGSPHTHCYSPTIDQCYNTESGCYSGSLSCPAGDGKGTVMSYCHVSSGANCGTNKSEFHPRVQTLIEGRLATNFPSCISSYEEPEPPDPPLFFDGFESD